MVDDCLHCRIWAAIQSFGDPAEDEPNARAVPYFEVVADLSLVVHEVIKAMPDPKLRHDVIKRFIMALAQADELGPLHNPESTTKH